MLVSYADKKSNATKKTNIVLLLSTMQDETRVSKDQWAKVHPIVYYDHMKGGVDVEDLISAMASTWVKNKRWIMNALFLCSRGTKYTHLNWKWYQSKNVPCSEDSRSPPAPFGNVTNQPIGNRLVPSESSTGRCWWFLEGIYSAGYAGKK